jgi:hypothetical protein
LKYSIPATAHNMNAMGLWSPDAPLCGTAVDELDAAVAEALLDADALELAAAELEDAAEDEDSEREDEPLAAEAEAEAEAEREDGNEVTAAAAEETEFGVLEPPVRVNWLE